MTTEEASSSRERVSNPNRGSKPGERRGGRQPGTPNKVTSDVRAAISEMLDAAAPHFAGWLERVAEQDPAKALDLALKAADFAIPRLSRVQTSHSGQFATLEALVAAATSGTTAATPAASLPVVVSATASPEVSLPAPKPAPPPAPVQHDPPPQPARIHMPGLDEPPYNPL